ncbi:MAG: methyl-accepting chemotaxis protein [Bacteroidota bacterium]
MKWTIKTRMMSVAVVGSIILIGAGLAGLASVNKLRVFNDRWSSALTITGNLLEASRADAPHQKDCPLEKWLETSERAELGRLIPAADPLLMGLEEPHRQWHAGNQAPLDAQLRQIKETVFGASSEAAQHETGRAAGVRKIIYLAITTASLALLGFTYLLAAGVSRLLRRTTAIIQDLAEGEGDLTVRLPLDSQDEIGEMANGFNRFMDKLQGMIKEIKTEIITLDEAASKLTDLSESMAQRAEGLNTQCDHAAIAANQMNREMEAVSEATHHSNDNLSSVAGATEEMTASIEAIAQTAEQARQAAQNASESIRTASDKMGQLDEAARNISQVVELIVEMAEQTKLLALNATIEAARAGEAGKGFAVVASEVKELARQTNEATEEIRNRIEAMQASTEGTVQEIQTVTQVVSGISESINLTAAAMEEQSATTRHISETISSTASGVEEMTMHLQTSAKTTHEVSENMKEAREAAAAIEEESQRVSDNALALSRLGSQLRTMVDRFKV